MNPNTSIALQPESLLWKISSISRARHLPGALLAIGLALCGTLAAPAETLQPWSTVDDIENGWQESIAADGAGNIFVAGDVSVGGITYGSLTKSSNQGATWETTVNQAVTYYSAVATAKVETPASAGLPATTQHHLVTVGEVFSRGEWVVSRSVDAGLSWVTLDVFKHPSWVSSSPGTPGVMGAAIDSAGNVYVIGFAQRRTVVKNKVSSASYWLVRKIGKDATALSEVGKTTMDLFETANGGYSWPRGVTCVGTNVFIAGKSGDRWQVRKNTGGGATWELVDDFRYSSNYPCGAEAITADSSGNLYVVGMGQRAVGRGTAGYWIVRKGTGVGTSSFQTADRFELQLNKTAQANGVSVDGLGNVHVTGHGLSTVGTFTPAHWITRRLSATTGNWETTDHYFLKADRTSAGWNIAADFAGNVFAVGTASDGAEEHDWVVRRQPAPVP